MRKYITEVLVIGGGATGLGILRDLAMRGFKTLLVEKGDLTHGTSGRYHGLLHSGGRYAVKDPHAAAECIQENLILRKIMPHCIEDTGGFFVLTPQDDPAYADRFLEGCRQAGIPVEEISPAQMLREEPLLNPHIQRCYHLPDGSADSFAAAKANAASARAYGAEILTYHKVTGLVMDQQHVRGARLLDLAANEEIEIQADMVVNAAGAWAGQIAAMAGLQVTVIPGKGTMLAVNRRIVHTVINRCKMPADGDILVPAHTVSVIGTTDVRVSDPDSYSIDPWEVRLMLEEGEVLVPGFKDMRMLRAWAGVRPLYQENDVDKTRDVTRAFVLLDHEAREGVDGLLTITSGKWTTYRKMAQAAVDLVCQKLGVRRECRTHLETLPASDAHGYHKLGARLAKIEKEHAYGELVCECELVTADDVTDAILHGGAHTLDDIRRTTRLGMGPCQGGFCTYRAAGLLHRLRNPAVEQTNQAMTDYLEERWKGLVPILWGKQLRQERLDELIYFAILAADRLPGLPVSVYSPQPYLPGEIRPNKEGINLSAEDTAATVDHQPKTSELSRPETANPQSFSDLEPVQIKSKKTAAPRSPVIPEPAQTRSQETAAAARKDPDVLVIGMGLAGLAAAWSAGKNGAKVRLVAKGAGALFWQPGCLELLGYHPLDASQPVSNPMEALAELARTHPQHPYALAGLDGIERSLEAFQRLCLEGGIPMAGDLEHNWLLPSATGAARPACLAPESMIAGDLRRSEPILIIGFNGYQDFYPEWIAANLARQGIPAKSQWVDVDSLKSKGFITSRVLAEAFDQPGFVDEVVKAVLSALHKQAHLAAPRIGFPAVLGLRHHRQAYQRLCQGLDAQVFEIPTLPPSIPGIRLHNLLKSAILAQGGQVFDAMQVSSAIIDNNVNLVAVSSEAAARNKKHIAEKFILASGGLLGGGMSAGYDGNLHELIFDLPVAGVQKERNSSAILPGIMPHISPGILPDNPLYNLPHNRPGQEPSTQPSLWINDRFLSPQAHPIFTCGIAVNQHWQPCDAQGAPLYDNLYAAGNLLAGNLLAGKLEDAPLSVDPLTGSDYLRQRAFDGVAWVSGYLAGETAWPGTASLSHPGGNQ